ncbi:elongation factor P maturation arginine rhamnosyltransferase EarP [Marinobacterium lutimaris]|uniref:Protein-arginine rhamnosyltransferase n=1 Tax=Marinobacterium lutimaris TaxID=568106 RepID=A0A1H5VGS5_9GAMM|nr:elongation factor P maturation arginine rhamnosyltransferase EarP [Marinobacterium lutimaris]SEF86424.1 conserved hypothetical protein, PP_1857 family [Marinobacterium lutimaris]
MKSWDIFCHVVDNYGDIGVTWRLARQLTIEFNQRIRLFVDDLGAFKHLCPDVDPARESQEVMGVEIVLWHPNLQIAPADIVIEAFACTLPEAVIAAMAERTPPSLWINLEYLSAEDWVESCHLLSSPQLCGPEKYFFFPGFGENTGGLLRENNLLNCRQQFGTHEKSRFLRKLGVSHAEDSMLISVFTYENPQITTWLDALLQSGRSYHLLVPPGRIENDIKRWLKVDSFVTGECYVQGQVRIQAIPFLSQQEYDFLLWCCDLNLVRGEDSFVRAQWAGKPFLWHIYQQDEYIHLDKLTAFLRLYLQGLDRDAADAVERLWMDWNRQKPLQLSWDLWRQQTAKLEQHAENWCSELAGKKSLAETLVLFAENW